MSYLDALAARSAATKASKELLSLHERFSQLVETQRARDSVRLELGDIILVTDYKLARGKWRSAPSAQHLQGHCSSLKLHNQAETA